MRALLVPVVSVVLVLASACGSEPGSSTEPSGDQPVLVHTRGVQTVLDAGSPVLCLDGVAESFPPQCPQGTPLRGWSWAGREKQFQEAGGVRWGEFHVLGRWDGTTLEVTQVSPAALYDGPADDPGEDVRPGLVLSSSPPATAPVVRPAAVPAARGLVQTRFAVTVLENATGQMGTRHGPQLCLGAVMDSLPPQCGGPELVGWDWTAHAGDFEERAGVRWGAFHLVGRFDGSRFTPTRVTPFDEYDAPTPADEVDFASPCPEPAGGWRVLDPDRTTEATQEATLTAASRLPGYAGAWLDQSPNDDIDETSMNDPRRLILNVRVTKDVAGAERRLRETWGGMLCVTDARHTAAELRQVQDGLRTVPGLLTSSSTQVGTQEHVDLEVVHDDGSIQAWVDQEHGSGLVRVRSALVPAP